MADGLLHLRDEHYPSDHQKDRLTLIGMAIDNALKEMVAKELGAIIPERYAPYDYILDGVYHEIKSTAGTWLSIPNSEIEFAEEQVASGGDVRYVIFQQFDLHYTRLLGIADYSVFRYLVEPSKFMTWRKQKDGSWVQERSYRILLARLKPLLT